MEPGRGPTPARLALRHPAGAGRGKGIYEAEVERIVAARPFHSLTDFWHRARVSRPVVERLVLAGGFDALYGIDARRDGVRRRRPGDPARPAAAGRRARPATPGPSTGPAAVAGCGGRSPVAAGSRPARPRVPRPTTRPPATAPTRAVRDEVAALERHPLGHGRGLGQGRRPVAGDRGAAAGRRRSSSPSTSATRRRRARSPGCRR